MELVGFRWADYDTPLWVNPNRSSGRWHCVGDDPTQYWTTRPLGPWAEYARRFHVTDWADLREVRSRLWAARLIFGPGEVLELTFDNASRNGIRPDHLVGDDHAPCQTLAQQMRPNYAGLIVPSAALPGASTIVLFGARVMAPYHSDPPDKDLDIPAALLAEHGGPPRSLTGVVCYRGETHAGLRAWQSGQPQPVVQPAYPWPT